MSGAVLALWLLLYCSSVVLKFSVHSSAASQDRFGPRGADLAPIPFQHQLSFLPHWSPLLDGRTLEHRLGHGWIHFMLTFVYLTTTQLYF